MPTPRWGPDGPKPGPRADSVAGDPVVQHRAPRRVWIEPAGPLRRGYPHSRLSAHRSAPSRSRIMVGALERPEGLEVGNETAAGPTARSRRISSARVGPTARDRGFLDQGDQYESGIGSGCRGVCAGRGRSLSQPALPAQRRVGEATPTESVFRLRSPSAPRPAAALSPSGWQSGLCAGPRAGAWVRPRVLPLRP